MREYAPNARPYELMTIFTPDVADDAVTEQLEVVAGYIRTAGGSVYQVLQDAPWGRRRFAYPIRHNGRDVRDGFYSVVHFDLVPGQVFEVERDLKLDERVLRFLLTLHEVKETPATGETTEGEAAPATPAPRTEIAAGDLVRNAEAARAAQEAARAAQEAARPAPAQDNRSGNREDRPRPAAQPATETPATVATGSSTEPAPDAPASDAPASDAPAQAVTETESAPNVAPAVEAAPVVESAPAAEPEAPSDQAPTEPETAPTNGDEPSRAQD